MVRILGLDPGLRHTGWGVIEKNGSRLTFIAAGVINPNDKNELSVRLSELHVNLKEVLESYAPDEAAVEETFVNKIKKMVVGVGHADKTQVDMMVRTLLKSVPEKIPPDAADALAIALCHSFLRPVSLKKMMERA